jgi:anti-anti-sigma factor
MSLLFHPDLLEVEVAGDTTVIRFTTPRFEDGNAEAIGQQLADLVDRLGRHKLHLDLGQVQFLSSLGLATLIALNKKVRAAGGEFRLDNVRPVAYRVFEATHLIRLLDIRPA